MRNTYHIEAIRSEAGGSWSRPNAQALRVVDQMGVERFRCV
jgi:hypothetical protein